MAFVLFSDPAHLQRLRLRYCILDAPERYGVHESAPIAEADMLLSGIADTLAMPYTIYQQNELGLIPVKRKQR